MAEGEPRKMVRVDIMSDVVMLRRKVQLTEASSSLQPSLRERFGRKPVPKEASQNSTISLSLDRIKTGHGAERDPLSSSQPFSK